MSDIIQPRVLKGFRDFLPAAESKRKALVSLLETTFAAFGFVPIDTPVLEYAEILLGKGGGETDKQVYRFRDNGDRDVAMRFDLTVPFARFMAEHVEELYLPFRRYHIAKVWRGENTQRGRYREFMQCDFDIVGTDSVLADTDIILTIDAAMRALDVGAFSVRVNHRGIFNTFLARRGLAGRSAEILRTVDKLEKAGHETTLASLAEIAGSDTASGIMEFIVPERDSRSTLAKLETLCGGGSEHVDRLAGILSACGAGGVEVVLDPSITRGLDYYTGVVFETTLSAMPGIGSVCSGGRYDELASLYTTRRLPGVGASVGLDRLMAATEGRASLATAETVDALVLFVDAAGIPRYQDMAARLRASGLRVEIYPEQRKPAQQFQYAERKGIRYAVIVGTGDPERGTISVRNLADRTTIEFSGIGAVAEYLASRRQR